MNNAPPHAKMHMWKGDFFPRCIANVVFMSRCCLGLADPLHWLIIICGVSRCCADCFYDADVVHSLLYVSFRQAHAVQMFFLRCCCAVDVC